MGRRMAEDVSTFISIRSDDCDLLTITQVRSEVGFDTVNYRSNCSLGETRPDLLREIERCRTLGEFT